MTEPCRHYNPVEVKLLVTGELVAYLCPDCLEQLPADFRPVKPDWRDYTSAGVFGGVTQYWTAEAYQQDLQLKSDWLEQYASRIRNDEEAKRQLLEALGAWPMKVQPGGADTPDA